jgi:hypothetical protein
VGNLVGFLPRSTELLPWFADTAWLPPYSWLLDHLVPAAPLVVVAGAAFEGTVAALLLTRRHTSPALVLAAAWTIGLTPAVGWPYCTTNVLLGTALALLWVRVRRAGARTGNHRSATPRERR